MRDTLIFIAGVENSDSRRARYRPFAHRLACFRWESFNLDDVEKMQPSVEITFSRLDFISDQLENLHLQEPEPPVQEEEQPPSIFMFLTGLEDTVKAGPLALSHHMNLYAHETITEFSREFILDKVFMLLADPRCVLGMDLAPLTHCILTDLPTRLRNAVATYSHWLCEATMAAPKLGSSLEGWDEEARDDDLDRFIAMASIHILDDGNSSSKPTINAKIIQHDAEHGKNGSDISFTNLINQAEYDKYLANYILGEDHIGDGLSPLQECYMATEDNIDS
jgi:hypothetical protein